MGRDRRYDFECRFVIPHHSKSMAHPGWVRTEMGTEAAPMNLPEGAKTAVDLALIGPDGPTGQYLHLGKPLPW